MQAIVVDQLKKTYAGRHAVNGISFEVERGETFALLGPNGAGKTTTIEILEGYRTADSGAARVLGLSPQSDGDELRARTGLVLQTTALEPELTVLETISAFARLYPSPRDITSVLEDVNLAHLTGNRVGNLSGGQKRRLEIALGIVGNPELVFLDEPTTGLDPEARRKIWKLVKRLNQDGCTIILSSHYMDEVQALASRLAIMVNGQIVALGKPEQLQAEHCTHSMIQFEVAGNSLPAGFPAELSRIAKVDNNRLKIEVEDPAAALAALAGWALKTRYDIRSLSVSKQSLEDIYLQLVAKQRESASKGDQ